MTFFVLALFMCVGGCSGPKFNSEEAEKVLANQLGTLRYNLQITTAFRTNVILRVTAQPVREARDQGRALMESFIAYLKTYHISHLPTDSVVFTIRLDTNPDVYIKWGGSSEDFLRVVKGTITLDDFLDNALKEEHWAEELG